MAILATKTLEDYGIEVNGIYVRINELHIEFPHNKYCNVSVVEYLNAKNRELGYEIGRWGTSMPMTEFGEDTLFTLEGMFGKAYAWLKTLDKYKGAIDC